jgi:hypothetical protein
MVEYWNNGKKAFFSGLSLCGLRDLFVKKDPGSGFFLGSLEENSGVFSGFVRGCSYPLCISLSPFSLVFCFIAPE